VGGVEEGFDLFDAENHGKFFFELGELDVGDGRFGKAVAEDEEFVEGAKGREVEADGRTGDLFFHEVEEVLAEVVGGEVSPGGPILRVGFLI